MGKTAVVYWSGTGNTKKMAECIMQSAHAAGAEASLHEASAFRAQMLDDLDAIAFGCPAMGAEELEDGEFAPMFSACMPKLSGKKLALFGSYGWGDGEWMRDWEQTCRDQGAIITHPYVICCEAPDTQALEACKEMGASLA